MLQRGFSGLGERNSLCQGGNGRSWVEVIQRIVLQVGSFTEETKAQRLADQLRKRVENVYVTPVETSIQTYYRVRIGPFETKESALDRAEQLSQMGYQVLVTSR